MTPAPWIESLRVPLEQALELAYKQDAYDAEQWKPVKYSKLECVPIIDPERQSLRDRVPHSLQRLATAARKFTTLRPESFWGSTRRKMEEPEPSYERRLWLLTSHLFTKHGAEALKVPSGADTLSDYIAQFDRLNGLCSAKAEGKP